MDSIRACLQEEVVVESARLSEFLINRGNATSPTTARKMISRATAEHSWLWRSEFLRLPSNSRLFALASDVGSPEFRRKVREILKRHRPGLSRICEFLEKGDALILDSARKLMAAPSQGKSKNPDFQAEIKVLQELKMADVWNDELIYHPRILEMDVLNHLMRKCSIATQMEGRVSAILWQYLREQNLVTWEIHSVPAANSNLALFNDYWFNGYSFSWLAPLIRYNSSRRIPTPVLADVYAETIETYHVESFLTRIDKVRSRAKMPILGVIAGNAFVGDAWNCAKRSGLMAINFRQLFGEQMLETLEVMKKTLLGEDESLFDGIAKSIDNLQSNPFIKDLRSIAFETLSAFIVRTGGWESVELGLDVPFNNASRDVDVSGSRTAGTEVIMIECKAYKKGKTLDLEKDVKKFFTETVPAFVKHQQRRNHGRIEECRAEIWTTGELDDRTNMYLQTLKLNPIIKAQIKGYSELKSEWPNSLKRCKELLTNIANT